MKFEQKKSVSFVSWQSVQKLSKTLEQVLFYETYFEESKMDRKPLIWAEDKIITKFGQKKGEFGFGQSVRKLPEN